VGVEGVPARTHPILYDLGIAAGFDPLDPTLEPARPALGDTRRLAVRLDLARTQPNGQLASTGYALARPGHDYVALRLANEALTLQVDPGTYRVHWFDIDHRTEQRNDQVIDEPGSTVVTCPRGEDRSGVVHLSRQR
jgi:hypothetical protein